MRYWTPLVVTAVGTSPRSRIAHIPILPDPRRLASLATLSLRTHAGKNGNYKLRSMPGGAPIHKPKKVRRVKPRKWTPREPSKDQEPLPDGWREEVRMPLSGRKYRVFLGPNPGMYAESVSKAWECQQRVEQRAREAAEALANPDAVATKKRARKACLACDHGRKRKCTCGRRSRTW